MNRADPDQMLHSAASDQGLHCLPLNHLQNSNIVKHPLNTKWTSPLSNIEKSTVNK